MWTQRSAEGAQRAEYIPLQYVGPSRGTADNGGGGISPLFRDCTCLTHLRLTLSSSPQRVSHFDIALAHPLPENKRHLSP
jgi:hypothetical protein